jgi:tRNA nucleotidyltransferase (CCA-adding enzyme)
LRTSRLLDSVLQEVRPTAREKEKVVALAKRFVERTKRVAEEIHPEATVFLGGSVRKDTFLASDVDIDIFVRLPPSLPRDDFEEIGLSIGRRVLSQYEIVERWAEHPYVEAEVEGIRVSVIPAYRTEGPDWKSAVDRTFYHVQCVEGHLDDRLKDQVLLLKRLMKTIGIYGAEAATEGFSGYVCELLIIAHDSFLDLLKSAAEWRPPKVVDIEGYHEDTPEVPLRLFEGEPLIVIDPVDKTRNAGSAVSRRSLAYFVSAAHAFLASPSIQFFEEHRADLEDLKKSLDNRGGLLGVFFRHGRFVQDTLHPQLERLARNLQTRLEEAGFQPLRWEVYSDYDTQSLILIELVAENIPEQYPHQGPHPYDAKNETPFLRENLPKSVHVWINREGRWAALRRRELTEAVPALTQILREEAIIPNGIREAVADSKIVAGGQRLLELSDGKHLVRRSLVDFLDLREFWWSEHPSIVEE